jgi:hypothetical protein
VVKKVCRHLGYKYGQQKNNSDGFKEASLNKKIKVASLTEVIPRVRSYGYSKTIKSWRTYVPCYADIENSETLRFVVILKPETDMDTVKTEIDAVYPSIQI